MEEKLFTVNDGDRAKDDYSTYYNTVHRLSPAAAPDLLRLPGGVVH
jgi:hypothetical protein